MTRTMKAAVVHHFGRPRSRKCPFLNPGEPDSRPYCRDGDLPYRSPRSEGRLARQAEPALHTRTRGVGTVTAVGRAVLRIKEGDRVGIPWLHTACGYCSYCRTGWETLCGSQSNSGYSVNGSFAGYALADPNTLGRLPSLTRMGSRSANPLRRRDRLQGPQGDRGEAGRMGRDLRRRRSRPHGGSIREAMGMHVAAVDVHQGKLELAKSLCRDRHEREGHRCRRRDAGSLAVPTAHS